MSQSEHPYLLHGTWSDENLDKIIKDWFEFSYGRGTVSQDLIFALTWTNPNKQQHSYSKGEVRWWWIILIKKPDTITTITETRNIIEIDELGQRIKGSFWKWRDGRNDRAIYPKQTLVEIKSDLEAIRNRKWIVDKQNILHTIKPTEKLKDYLWVLEYKIKRLEFIDLDQEAQQFKIILDDKSLPEDFYRQILLTTINNQVMSLVRYLRLRRKKVQWWELTRVVWKRSRLENKYDTLSDEELKDKIQEYHAIVNNKDVLIYQWDDILKRYLRITINSIYNDLFENYSSNNSSTNTLA